MTPEPQFLRRFEQIRASLRRHGGALGSAATILAMATALGILACADYRQELPRATRAAGLATAVLVVASVAWRWLVAPLRWWTRPRTAAEIEARFPALGQRIRTVVQYGGQPADRVAAAGVEPSLVAALAADTAERSTTLPLDRIARWRDVAVVAALGAVPIALLALAAARSHEWRVAIGRAVLIDRPYTTVAVEPGDVLVDQGADVPLRVTLAGRPRPAAVLQTRSAGKPDAPWKSAPLADPSRATVARVKDPVEYRVVAGPAASLPHTIRVRYPLAIRDLAVEVKAPAYTGIDPKTSRGGDVQAVEGSVATFRIVFDGAPSAAALELVDPRSKGAKPGDPPPAPAILPLRREGDALVASLDLVRNLTYRVVARTADGRILPPNKHRIDVAEDRAPRVSFDEPDEALEVHTIAEVRHRARASDDFGLTRAGIVFRFNDGDEQTLILRDFAAPPGAKPKTAATLEETLLIETLNATSQDSVTYYGFAEDNFPAGARRTETDLRYIDFRPFRREYKLAEPTGSGDGETPELIALDELVARQRVNLNRANRLARRRATDRTEADNPLKIAEFEEALLNLSKEFTEGIERLADAQVDSLHKALDAMQAAIDALDRSKLADAPPAMAEALKHLVAARRELAQIIGANPTLAKAIRSFDRRQAQKIRKPKGKDDEAEEIADRLEQLAQEEEFVYATLKSDMGNDEAKAPAPGAEPAAPKDAGAEPAEPKDGGAEPAEAKKEAGAEPAEPKDGPGSKPSQGPAPGRSGRPGQGGPGRDGPPGAGAPNQGPADGADPTPGEAKRPDRRAVAAKQEALADEVRDLEAKLKRLEAASDLAKARMARAAEKVEQASGALDRGNTREAAQGARDGAGMLHELARQVHGEITPEAADELAMARDLAGELARREADFADRVARPTSATKPGAAKAPPGKGSGKEEAKTQDPKGGEGRGDRQPKGQDGKEGTAPGDKGQGADVPGDREGQGADGKEGKAPGDKGQGADVKEGKAPGDKGQGADAPGGREGEGADGKAGAGRGTGPGTGPGTQPGPGGVGGWEALTEAEQVERMAEMARTLEAWLRGIERRGQEKSAEAVREILEGGAVAQVVERAGRMDDLRAEGRRPELGREARELAAKLEAIGQALELLHRGIVAPELAAMVEFDRRVAELTAALADLKSEAQAEAWRREVAALVRDLDKAGIAAATDLADSLRAGGGWRWDVNHRHYIGPELVTTALHAVAMQIKDRVQDLILKDLASARDEATPPPYRELVDRYYEVLSQGARAR